ncbi:MAG: trigger factor [Lachnospiraceae bacterium]|nr:trigger factor [Lachnospiraceae bacterium]
MSFTIEKLEKNMAKITIEVAVEEFEKAVEKAYQKNKSSIQIQGFRKGKAPRKMIEQMYGKEVFFEDAANIIIPEVYANVYDECEEEIVSSPMIDVVQIEAGKPFIFTAEVALKPEVKLGKYKGVTVPKAEIEVTEEEINEAIERERKNSARTVTVEDRPVQDGDTAVIDFEGFVDGVAFEGGKGDNYPLTIGSHSFIEGFEEQLIGKALNEEVEVNVTFPEDYHAEELKGKPAVFKVKINEIKENQLPELDDEFASEVSAYDTLEEYKESVKKNLTEKKEADAKMAKEEAVVDAIIEAAEMEVPDAMVLTSQRQMMEEFSQRIQMQGLSMEQYLQFTGQTANSMMEQVKPQAEKRIKSRLVLEAVVAAEKIEVSDAEYEEELGKMASAYQMEVEQIKDLMDAEREAEMKKDIAIQKAVDFVVSKAKEK